MHEILILISLLVTSSVFILIGSHRKKAEHKNRKSLIFTSEKVEANQYIEPRQPSYLAEPITASTILAIEETPADIERKRILTNLREKLLKELTSDGHERLALAIEAGQTDTLSLNDKDIILKYSRKVRGLSIFKIKAEHGMAWQAILQQVVAQAGYQA